MKLRSINVCLVFSVTPPLAPPLQWTTIRPRKSTMCTPSRRWPTSGSSRPSSTTATSWTRNGSSSGSHPTTSSSWRTRSKKWIEKCWTNCSMIMISSQYSSVSLDKTQTDWMFRWETTHSLALGSLIHIRLIEYIDEKAHFQTSHKYS